MFRFKSWAALATLVGAALVAGACSDRADEIVGPESPSLLVTGDKVYYQIDFLANPLVSEVTVPKKLHLNYNLTMPYTSAQFIPVTNQFITGFGRPQALADLLSSVLYNNGAGDMMIYYPDRDPATAGWLSWALQPGVGAGGRKLTDDTVDLALTAVFSGFLNPTGAICQPFQLPLCTDNVSAPARAPSTTFPYLADPF